MSRARPRYRVDLILRPNDATALLHAYYWRFIAHISDSAADRRIDIPPRGLPTCRFSTHHLSASRVPQEKP